MPLLAASRTADPSATAPPAESFWRRWWPFALVIGTYAVVALQQITLPGVYMDAVNPDYIAVGLLDLKAEPLLPWLLPGNLLLDRAPIMISFYHGSQQVWLGLPFFAIFGTDVAGLRLTHAMFALGVLAALYAWLGRSGARPWHAAIACAALALDPAFSYAFRTQSYITLAPAAWLFLALYALARANDARTRVTAWLLASGLFYGLAVVGYFIYAFFLPALVLAVAGLPTIGRTPRTWMLLTAGALVGGIWYPIGYALAARHLGGVGAAWEYFQQTQRAIHAFSGQPDFADRVTHLLVNVQSVFHNWYHQSLIFGGPADLPGARYKTSLLLGGALLLWGRAEWKRQPAWPLRTMVALFASFVAIALVFGTRLSGHHFMVLLPIAYCALALGLVALSQGPPSWGSTGWTVALPFAALVAINTGGQVEEAARLHEVRGVGLYSDAINRMAADLDADPRRPVVYFPDWGLFMPVVFLTGGRVATDTTGNVASLRKTLCAGRDVAVAFVTGDRVARIREWRDKLAWDAPGITPYAQADGKLLFEVARFRGRRGAPDC